MVRARKWEASRCNYTLWQADTRNGKLHSICPFQRICNFSLEHTAGTWSWTLLKNLEF